MTAAPAGGGLAEVLAVLDADLRYTEQRLAKTRRKADESAARKGDRQPGADDHCDWVEHVLLHKRAARAAIAELIEAAREVTYAPVLSAEEVKAMARLIRALEPFSGAALAKVASNGDTK